MRPPAPWHIVDVELSDEAKPLAKMDRPVLVVFRYRGAVLGFWHALPSDLPITASEMARIAAVATGWTVLELLRLGLQDETMEPATRAAASAEELATSGAEGLLARLDRSLAVRQERPIPVTGAIVICTRNRAADLRDCLESVSAEIDAGREVIVIDNGPDPDTEAVVRDFPGVRYVVEAIAGLNSARNAGLRAATADVVVYVDDDVRPEPGWVDALLRRFDKSEVGVVCGLVLPHELETDAQVAFQYELGFGGMGMLPISFDESFLRVWRPQAPIWEIGAGANMAIRRKMALECGGFDERVGAGRAGGCGDDTEFWHNVLFSGGEARYEPLSVVRHRHRRTWAELHRQAYGYGYGHVVSLFATYARSKNPGELARVFFVLPAWYATRVLALPRRWINGDPDQLLLSSIRGYFGSFRHIGMAFTRQTRDRTIT